jgi:hypothetical protein
MLPVLKYALFAAELCAATGLATPLKAQTIPLQSLSPMTLIYGASTFTATNCMAGLIACTSRSNPDIANPSGSTEIEIRKSGGSPVYSNVFRAATSEPALTSAARSNGSHRMSSVMNVETAANNNLLAAATSNVSTTPGTAMTRPNNVSSGITAPTTTSIFTDTKSPSSFYVDLIDFSQRASPAGPWH